ncbi:hypothetical protein [uncultured Cytophaga sp.]|uniref:hypothetical protein n=1 Tax=uncultured Cytophaga sp. TaxID=160238 RepID=UPI00262DF737|nr:hypothetical protein [uncultured Cytophaga sp.]
MAYVSDVHELLLNKIPITIQSARQYYIINVCYSIILKNKMFKIELMVASLTVA